MSYEPVLKLLIKRYPELESVKSAIKTAAEVIIRCYSAGGKLLICGNGGSSSDSEHMVAELMKSFELKRPVNKEIAEKLAVVSKERGRYLGLKMEGGFPAISLSSQTSLTSAISNDIDASLVFAQQVLIYGTDKDVLFAISTSGNSQNVIDACITAKAKKMKVIGLTGPDGGKMKPFCDTFVNVPATRTALVQELHLPVIHILCQIIENHFYGNN